MTGVAGVAAAPYRWTIFTDGSLDLVERMDSASDDSESERERLIPMLDV
jgi:hypothetical protein